jgi:hypothetical protein|nr:MAG TPA: InsA C-terminal domain [Caudoviricetes sp.]
MAARYDWETIRAEYEAGASQSDLARRYGVSRTAIQKRIRAENWTQDVSDVINRMAEAKVAGVVAGCNPKKKAAALDRAADRKAEKIREQREVWDGLNRDIRESMKAGDFERLKCLKIGSEALRNVQECERKAWGIVEADIRPAVAQKTEQDAIREGIREAFRSVGLAGEEC